MDNVTNEATNPYAGYVEDEDYIEDSCPICGTLIGFPYSVENAKLRAVRCYECDDMFIRSGSADDNEDCECGTGSNRYCRTLIMRGEAKGLIRKRIPGLWSLV